MYNSKPSQEGFLKTTGIMNKPTADQINPELIEQWKKQHGTVLVFRAGEGKDKKVGYFHTPTRKAYSYASVAGQKDPMEFNSILFKESFLGGDIEIIENNDYFMSISQNVEKLMNLMVVEVEKL